MSSGGLSILVIDSWALMEWILDGPFADRVEEILSQAKAGWRELVMSWVNAGEVVYMLSRKRSPRAAEDFLAKLPSLPIRLILPTAESVVAAARIKARSKLSYADAFAVELAVERHAAVVTGDPEIAALGFLGVVWIGG